MPTFSETQIVSHADVDAADKILRSIVRRTPLEFSERLSALTGARVYLKREDLQTVRSYKVRGAYHKMSRLSPEIRQRGVVCASAGNHAQGVAFSCRLLSCPGIIFMPRNTPRQKVARVRDLGGDWVRLELGGDTFDAAKEAAEVYSRANALVFVPPFDDADVIAGQGTVGREILEQLREQAGESCTPDWIFAPVGGGGLLAGISVSVASLRDTAPATRLMGVEPAGAASLAAAFDAGKPVSLAALDTFVDGAAVRQVGALPYALLSRLAPSELSLISVPEGQVCASMIRLYQSDGIIAEPAGALTVAALEAGKHGENLVDKTVVAIVSGGNNDLSRYPEVVERSLLHAGLKHYFLIEFSQRAGALRQYLDEALGPSDDITLFEYVKKNNREFGPALVGIELTSPQDLTPLMDRMDAIGLSYQRVSPDSPMYRFLL